MKKILAFLTSLLILCLIVALLHEFLPKSSLVNNREFGGWCSMYKDMSARAIGQNMQEDSMLVMRSSEFDHPSYPPITSSLLYFQHLLNEFKLF